MLIISKPIVQVLLSKNNKNKTKTKHYRRTVKNIGGALLDNAG